jgi:hypothetical protein
MNEHLFETFACCGCGAPVRSKYKAPPGETFRYFCVPCGQKEYARRVGRAVEATGPGVDSTKPTPGLTGAP